MSKHCIGESHRELGARSDAGRSGSESSGWRRVALISCCAVLTALSGVSGRTGGHEGDDQDHRIGHRPRAMIEPFVIAGTQTVVPQSGSILTTTDASSLNPNDFGPAILIAFNARMNAVALADHGYGSVKGARGFAMMFVAAHDALNTIVDTYERFALIGSECGDAHPIAAVAQAAFEIGVHMYPNFASEFQAERDIWLATVPNGSAKDNGIALGIEAADAVIDEREGDGFPDESGNYVFSPPAPGVYQTYPPHNGFVVFHGVGQWRPMMSDSGDFRPSGPPSVTSGAYKNAFNEVKSVGKFSSETRTEEQTSTALWWRDDPEEIINRTGGDLATATGRNLWKTARMFALMNMSMFDAYIHVFEAKYHYNFWRPFTGILEAATDGNPNTAPDPTWTNLLDGAAPPHPSFPSAHTSITCSALQVLRKTFGNNTTFQVTSDLGPPDEPATRTFNTFSSACDDVANSRLWLGFHWRFDNDKGKQQGINIGNHADANFLGRTKRTRP
jgi:PAP2 superfamily